MRPIESKRVKGSTEKWSDSRVSEKLNLRNKLKEIQEIKTPYL